MEPWLRLNEADPEAAAALLRTCCGARRWVERMLARRPFDDQAALLTAAREVWFALDPADWLEAFSHHPQIGDLDGLARRFAATAHLSGREQQGVAAASAGVLAALAEQNQAYHARFGYIFIVCASGRTAGEMLTLLRLRLDNDPSVEIRIAAGEQAAITALRLQQLA